MASLLCTERILYVLLFAASIAAFSQCVPRWNNVPACMCATCTFHSSTRSSYLSLPLHPIQRNPNPGSSFHYGVGPAQSTSDASVIDVAPPTLPFFGVVQNQQPDHPSDQRAISDPQGGDCDQRAHGNSAASPNPAEGYCICHDARTYQTASATDTR